MSAGRHGRLPCVEVEPARVRLLPGEAGAGLRRAELLLAAGRDVALDVDAWAPCDVALVGGLARLRLASCRSGAALTITAPDGALRHLAELMGLCEVLGVQAPRG